MEFHAWMTTESIGVIMTQQDRQQQEEGRPGLEFFQSGPGKLMYYLIFYLGCPMMTLLAISTNAINIVVFLRGGLNDGMAINFLGLAVSDLLYNVFYFMGRNLNTMHSVFHERPYLNTRHLAYICAKHGRLWFNVSILLTVFAAIQKCACIAIPLTFRNFFTPRKSAIAVLGIYVAVVTFFLPFLAIDQLKPYTERSTNRTRLGYSLRDRKLGIKISRFMTYANKILLPYICQGIVIVCVFTMTIKLRRAAEIRRKMTSTTNNGANEDVSDVPAQPKNNQKEKIPHESDKTNKTNDNVLSSKELRVIRSVNILCGIFIAGTTPQTLIGAFDMAFTEFGDKALYASVYFFSSGLQQLLEIMSTAVNVFVYYRFNSKYKRTFSTLFSCCLCIREAEGDK